MALRFRKSIKLAPGVRMNLSGSGLSWTLGPRGASIGLGKRGTYLNTGIPGTGLYAREPLRSSSSRAAQRNASTPAQTTNVSLNVTVSDDGAVTITDEDGNPAPEAFVDAAKKQKGDVIQALIVKKCNEINDQIEALARLHLGAPNPNEHPVYTAQSFPEPEPGAPRPKTPSFLDKLFKGRRTRLDAQNAAALSAYQAEHQGWKDRMAKFTASESRKKKLFDMALAGDPGAMEDFFGEILNDIVWPRETEVSFEVRDDGKELAFDVDLPELEDMPTKTASVPSRGFRVSVKALSPTAVQKMYAQHMHSIGFRLLGEAFGMLPTVRLVTLSGYSQRRSKSTGQQADEYLFSVRVQREQWMKIDFKALESIDVIESFTMFDLRRSMTKTGIFSPVEPF